MKRFLALIAAGHGRHKTPVAPPTEPAAMCKWLHCPLCFRFLVSKNR